MQVAKLWQVGTWALFKFFYLTGNVFLMLLVFREMGNREALVEHVKTCHEEYRKGCEEFPCLWEVPGNSVLSINSFFPIAPL